MAFFADPSSFRPNTKLEVDADIYVGLPVPDNRNHASQIELSWTCSRSPCAPIHEALGCSVDLGSPGSIAYNTFPNLP